MEKSIEINETENPNPFGNKKIPDSYNFTIMDGQPNPTRWNYYTEFLSGHYILQVSAHISGREGVSRGVKGVHRGMFDVAHGTPEAEKKLYDKAKASVESYAKDFGITKIVDNTKFSES